MLYVFVELRGPLASAVSVKVLKETWIRWDEEYFQCLHTWNNLKESCIYRINLVSSHIVVG